ncbi:MAG: VOC family protein [Chloroflexi bacterium]|nr:VOC family protein [Chloroflexota bacterium]MBU1747349.1 VOC family protein [Chloroflexota bacterium]
MNRNDHTAFQVSDMDAAIRFYTESLGLRLLFRSVNPEEQEAYAFLKLEGGNLELIQKLNVPFAKPQITPPYCPHFALETDDMAQVLQMISEKGISIVKGPLEIPGEEKWIYVSDPDNNVIEYIEWTSRKHH